MRDHEASNTAFLERANREKITQGFRVTLDLNTARDINDPKIIDFPFRSVFVEQASDPSCNFFLKPSNREDMQRAFRMGLKDSWSLPYQIPRCFLHWDQQIGKKIELVFFADSEFRSGSQISVTSGGVAIVDGSSFTVSNQSVPATTVTQVLAADFGRKVATIQNNTGNKIYFGNSSVSNTGANRGREIEIGGIFTFRNTSELYVYQLAAGSLNIIQEF